MQLAYVSKQLGHADVSITARHHAHWEGNVWRAPLTVGANEFPADLLARIGRSKAVTQAVTVDGGAK